MAALEESDRRGIALRADDPESGSVLQVTWSKNPGGLVQLYIEAHHRPSDRSAAVTWDLSVDDAEMLAQGLTQAARDARRAARRIWGGA